MATELTLRAVLALPALLAGIGLTITVADRLGAHWRDTALLLAAVVLMAVGLTGIHTLT